MYIHCFNHLISVSRNWNKEKMTKEKPSLFSPFAKFLGLNYFLNVIYIFLKVY